MIIGGHYYFKYYASTVLENTLSISVVYFECMMLATIYAIAKSIKHHPQHDKKYLIILGCHVREDGMPGGVLRKRVEAGIKFAEEQKKQTNRAPVLIFSGGKGEDEPISEARSMEKYVIAKRYDGRIIIEDKSRTTYQNFKYSKAMMKSRENVAFATTDYHVFRSGVLASKLGFSHIEGIGAKSPWYFYYNALIREFIANLQAEWKMHLFNILMIDFCVTLIVIVGFVFKII